jgi:hypothetical protein
VLIDPDERVTYAYSRQLDDVRQYVVRCPRHNAMLQREIGPEFRCETRLAFTGLDLESAAGYRVRFTYRHPVSRAVRTAEIRIRRRLVEY